MKPVEKESPNDGVGLTWDDGTPLTTSEGKAWWAGWEEGNDDGRADMEEELRGEIEGLREALRVIADGDAPRDHAIIYRSDGVHSKHDRCRHGAWMYDGCEDCVTEYARAALGEGK